MFLHAEKTQPSSWLSASLWSKAQPSSEQAAPLPSPLQTAVHGGRTSSTPCGPPLPQVATDSGHDSNTPCGAALHSAAAGSASGEQLAQQGGTGAERERSQAGEAEGSSVLEPFVLCEASMSAAAAGDNSSLVDMSGGSDGTHGEGRTAPDAEDDLGKSNGLQDEVSNDRWQGGATRFFCVVCLRDYERGEVVRILPCIHRCEPKRPTRAPVDVHHEGLEDRML